MDAYFISIILFIIVAFLLKGIIDDGREHKRQARLELYRRAELIGRRRIDLCIQERSKTRT